MKQKTRKITLAVVLAAGIGVGVFSQLLRPVQSAMQAANNQKMTPRTTTSGVTVAGAKPQNSSGSNAVSAALSASSATSGNSNSQAVASATKVSYGLTDGTYVGAREYAYYGYVRVQAVVQNGQLSNVQVLEHPNDNGTSRYINSIAMPYLVQEAVQAKSTNISLISGATLSSQAFLQSLSSALTKAGA
ncbi:MAG TPA: FMN-binding protein [Spirochaetia bacterium]|nr:FMN-binding protein [Spirochaetia bacterium]